MNKLFDKTFAMAMGNSPMTVFVALKIIIPTQ